MTNYPDTTYEYDPRAPWNQDDPPACSHILHLKSSKVDGTWEFCPWCGEPIDWNRWDDVSEVWR